MSPLYNPPVSSGGTSSTTVIPSWPMKSGLYYSPNFLRGLGTALLAQGELRAALIGVQSTVTINSIACEVTTIGSAGAVIRLGIYRVGTDGFPTTLVIDAGTVDAATTGVKTITISQVLTAGNYCLAACVQGAPATAPAVRICSLASSMPQPTGTTYHRSCFTQYSVTGALPATFTTTPGIDSGDMPHVQVRVA